MQNSSSNHKLKVKPSIFKNVTNQSISITGKVNGGDAVQDDENVGIRQLFEAEIQAGREHEHQHLRK